MPDRDRLDRIACCEAVSEAGAQDAGKRRYRQSFQPQRRKEGCGPCAMIAAIPTAFP